MKKNLFVVFFILLGTIISHNNLKADEVVVPDGAQIFDFIMGDTTSTGERTVPGRIYKLERGKIYIFTDVLQVDFDFYLVADDDDPNNPTRPPMLVRGVYPDGSLVDNLIFINGDDINVEFKNLLFQGVPLDNDYRNDLAVAIGGTGSNVTLKIDNCVFNGWSRAAVRVRIANIKFYARDNYFRNLVQPVHPFHGQPVTTYSGEDTLIYTNNSFFNSSSYVVLTNPSLKTNYLKFDHNTIFTSIVNPFYMPSVTNAEFTNNIIYGALALGQRQREIEAGWFGWDNIPAGIMNYDTLSADLQSDFGINESDRRIVHRNNAWFIPQEYKDYWNSFEDSVAIVDANGDTTGWNVQPLAETMWMNAAVQGMFDDDANYPNLIDENTMNADPQFDPTMTQVLVDSVMSWVDWWRSGLGWNSADGPARQYDFTDDQFNLPWPLPENLTYSNAALAAASTEGLHLGDLNWYPDEKAVWLTDIKKDDNPVIPNEITLSQNYPNPFNPTTVINFALNDQNNVSLAVFNALGQKVATLVNKELSAGHYKYTFDARELSSGIYFYTLKVGNSFVQTKKMLLLK